jgi:hypothetical protein
MFYNIACVLSQVTQPTFSSKVVLFETELQNNYLEPLPLLVFQKKNRLIQLLSLQNFIASTSLHFRQKLLIRIVICKGSKLRVSLKYCE